MHLQIRTSPGTVGSNVSRSVAALARRGVNVEGVGPDYESPHVRIVVPHVAMDDALSALKEEGFAPQELDACTFALEHRPGQLARILQDVTAAGFEVQSVLVLASRLGGRTLVSIGVDPRPSREQRDALGCVDEPQGWLGGDIDRPAAS